MVKIVINEVRQAKEYGVSEIALADILRIVLKYKYFIILAMLFSAAGTVYYVKSLPNVYQSVVLLSPSQNNSSSGMTSKIGGLASLAGIRLNKDGGVDKTKLSLEIIKSRTFFKQFAEKYDVYVPLMAAASWDPNTRELLIDSEVYDVELEKWVRDVRPPLMSEPSLEEASILFNKEYLSVSVDDDSGLVRIIVQHISPDVAMNWANELVKEINLFMKQLDQKDAENYIMYLNEQLNKTAVAQMQEIFYELIEEQTKNLMLSQVKEDYIFSVIDPASSPLYPVLPKRALLCVSIFTFCFVIILVVIFLFHFARVNSKSKH